MNSFLEWLKNKHPDCLDEGILDSLGKNNLVRNAVAAAGLLGTVSASQRSMANEPAVVNKQEKGPLNRAITNPKEVPDWYKPILIKWYEEQIALIRRIRGNPQPLDDTKWLEKAIHGDTSEIRQHTTTVSGSSVKINEPLKNPGELMSKVSDKYRSLLIKFYQAKIEEIREDAIRYRQMEPYMPIEP